MAKTIIAPIVAFLIVAIKLIFGVELPEELGGQITDVIVVAASLAGVVYGIFKNHNTKQDI